MQIVINVPDKLICEGFERPFTEEEKNILIKAIGNGVSLDKMRAEFIERYPKNYAGEPELGGAGCHFSLNKVLDVIDKYATEIESQENEGKNEL